TASPGWSLPLLVGQGTSRRAKSPSLPTDHAEPRLRPALAEGHVLQIGADLDPYRLDGLDVPALAEGGMQFVFRHPPRPLRARLFVTEAHQKQTTAWFQHPRQPLDVAASVV